MSSSKRQTSGSVGTVLSQCLCGQTCSAFATSSPSASVSHRARALSSDMLFMPSQAEVVQTGDMLMAVAICSHVIPDFSFAAVIAAVISCLFMMISFIKGSTNADFSHYSLVCAANARFITHQAHTNKNTQTNKKQTNQKKTKNKKTAVNT